MIEWRRSKVLELSSQGHNQSEIAQIMQVAIFRITWLVGRLPPQGICYRVLKLSSESYIIGKYMI